MLEPCVCGDEGDEAVNQPVVRAQPPLITWALACGIVMLAFAFVVVAATPPRQTPTPPQLSNVKFDAGCVVLVKHGPFGDHLDQRVIVGRIGKYVLVRSYPCDGPFVEEWVREDLIEVVLFKLEDDTYNEMMRRKKHYYPMPKFPHDGTGSLGAKEE